MIINIRVKPGSKNGPLVEPNLLDDTLVVYVREPAVNGQANQAVIELLARYYKVPKTRVRIIQGQTSRAKTVEVAIV